MIKTMFLVPLKDNDGVPFSGDDWGMLEERLLTMFGGYTDGGVVRGAWTSQEGRVYRDESRCFLVALESWAQFPYWLDIVRWAREHFRQEAIYVEVAGIPSIIGD